MATVYLLFCHLFIVYMAVVGALRPLPSFPDFAAVLLFYYLVSRSGCTDNECQSKCDAVVHSLTCFSPSMQLHGLTNKSMGLCLCQMASRIRLN